MMFANWHPGGFHPLAWLFGLAVLAALVALVIWIIHTLTHRPSSPTTPSAPTAVSGAEQILAERLARGEISEDEYRSRLGALRDHAR
jgi:putative membrane protein